jgi:small ligand-binding sensory domain FIST
VNEGAPLEPNETIAMAYATPVARTMANFELSDIAICPQSDVDTYQVDIPTNNTNLTVNVFFNAGVAALTLDILSASGARVAMGGTVTTGNVRATISNLAQGFYYAQVKASDGENEYRINFATSN